MFSQNSAVYRFATCLQKISAFLTKMWEEFDSNPSLKNRFLIARHCGVSRGCVESITCPLKKTRWEKIRFSSIFLHIWEGYLTTWLLEHSISIQNECNLTVTNCKAPQHCNIVVSVPIQHIGQVLWWWISRIFYLLCSVAIGHKKNRLFINDFYREGLKKYFPFKNRFRKNIRDTNYGMQSLTWNECPQTRFFINFLILFIC